jgi:hypothetical protein
MSSSLIHVRECESARVAGPVLEAAHWTISWAVQDLALEEEPVLRWFEPLEGWGVANNIWRPADPAARCFAATLEEEAQPARLYGHACSRRFLGEAPDTLWIRASVLAPATVVVIVAHEARHLHQLQTGLATRDRMTEAEERDATAYQWAAARRHGCGARALALARRELG